MNTLPTLLLALMALIASGCNLGQLKDGSSSSKAKDTSSSSNAFSPSSDARKDLGDALRRLKSAYPYRLTEITTATMNGNKATPDITRVVEFAAADRSHMKMSGGNGEQWESITIGEKKYSYSNGTWTEYSGPSLEEKTKRAAEFEKKLAEGTNEVKYVGAETVNGVSSYAYTFSLEINGDGHVYRGTGKAWVGAADGLPHQIDSEFKYGTYGHNSHITYDYNVDFKVEKPSM